MSETTQLTISETESVSFWDKLQAIWCNLMHDSAINYRFEPRIEYDCGVCQRHIVVQ